jgi:hypothetical protein
VNEIEKIHVLKGLAKRGRAHYEQSEALLAPCQAAGIELIKERILLGQVLLEAKTHCAHGQWYPWLAKHFPEVSAETLRRYMRLANESHVTDLATAAGLRQAYVACGILEQPPAEEGTATEAPEMSIDRLAKWMDWFTTRLSAAPMLNWSREQRDRMASVLRPLVDLYHRLVPPPLPP